MNRDGLKVSPIPNEGRLVLAVRRAQLEAEQARILAELAAEAAEADDDVPMRATPVGDWRRMRGLPMIGRGVAGAVSGSNPEREVVRRLGEWSGRA